MPSERFHKLKSVKKRTFLKMAYQEFAMHSYEGASITRLVADLKMAKGSIYQYFKDKEDLYQYLVEHAHQQLLSVVNKTCPLPNEHDDFSEWIQKLLLIQVKFLLAVPTYASLFLKNKVELTFKLPLVLIRNKIEKASRVTNQSLSSEKLFFLDHLPIFIFNYILASEEIDLTEIVKSDSSIAVSTDKLLYLCEAFLKKA